MIWHIQDILIGSIPKPRPSRFICTYDNPSDTEVKLLVCSPVFNARKGDCCFKRDLGLFECDKNWGEKNRDDMILCAELIDSTVRALESMTEDEKKFLAEFSAWSRSVLGIGDKPESKPPQ